jgi:co-chaperonin GroES (HSP10)
MTRATQKPPCLLPAEGRVVVEVITEEQTPSGLYLPQSSIEHRATMGKIIALPPEYHKQSARAVPGVYDDIQEVDLPEFSVGDVVLFGQNSGFNLDVGYGSARRRAIVLRIGEILCKVLNEDGEPYA